MSSAAPVAPNGASGGGADKRRESERDTPRGSARGDQADDERARQSALPSPGAVVERWRGELFKQVRRRPAQTLLVVAGTGYLAGGGLGTILTARLLSLGARMAMRLAILPILASEIERAFFDDDDADPGLPRTGRNARRNQLTHQKEIET